MSGNEVDNNTEKNLVRSVFEKIETNLLMTKPLVASLRNCMTEYPQFEADINSMESACDLFSDLMKHELSFILNALDTGRLTEERLKASRHDLRAKVGAILGYSELVLEELGDEGLDDSTPCISVLSKIATQAKNLIPVIDGLRLDGLAEEGEYESLDQALEQMDLNEPTAAYEEQYNGSTVLIIDDSAYNRQILSRRLARYGVRVLTAEDGAKGLEVVAQSTVDLILLDIMMPVMNGYETLTHLKQDPEHKHIPVLMISALSEVDSIVRCIEAGAEDYLPTPFNPVILNARIKACLDKKLLRDREQENLQKLEVARQKLETAIESIDDGFAVFDKDQRLTMSNERYKLLYPSVAKLGYHGFTKEELVREIFKMGLLFEERRHADPRADTEDEVENKVRQIMALLDSGEPILIRLRDGRWIEVTSNATPDGGCVCVHKDVTGRKEDEDRLTHMALHDSLTGLYNRAAFEAQLHEQFEKCKEQGQEFGLMFLDLDGFKGINDTMGHEVGDQVLIHVAHMLKKCIRVEDLVARLGGDEFAVIISEPVDRDSMSHIANRVLEAVGGHYEHQGVKAPFGVSIGIACYPTDGDTIDTLLANSDSAMYAAKKSGKGHYRFYSDLKNNEATDASGVSFPVSI